MHRIMISGAILLGFACGCTSVSVTGRDPNTYLICDNRKQEEVRLIGIIRDYNLLPFPSKTWVLLVDEATAHNPGEPRRLLTETPKWRRLWTNGACVFNVAYAACRQFPRERLRWILSINPLVVGIGDRLAEPDTGPYFPKLLRDGPVEMGAWMRMVRKGSADLEAPISAMVIVEPWPGDVSTEAPVVPGKRVIEVGANATVKTAMERICGGGALPAGSPGTAAAK